MTTSKDRIIHISIAKEVDVLRKNKGKPAAFKANTREHVLAQIREFGGFTVFWATENQKRAKVIDAMSHSGEIVRVPDRGFPWCAYEIKGDSK